VTNPPAPMGPTHAPGLWRHISPWYVGAFVVCFVIAIVLAVQLGAFPLALPFLWIIPVREHFVLSRRTREPVDNRPPSVPIGHPKEEALFALSVSSLLIGIGLIAISLISADDLTVSDPRGIYLWAFILTALGTAGILIGRVFIRRRAVAHVIEGWSER
jgi:hypothetical protein